MEDIEVLCALPPYLALQQPLVEAARNPLPNLGNRPFGLPLVVRRQPESPEGTNPTPPSDNVITDAELACALSGALYPTITISD